MIINAMPVTTPIGILLVDDDDGDVKAVQRAFTKVKIANPIERAIDGVDALEILRGTNGRSKINAPYLLLVDLNMPRMNGVELVREMRADPILHQTLIFMLTTSKRDEDKLAAYSLNIAGYILKEKAGEDFLNLVALVGTYWRIVEIP
jgi:CheY-like chemotaxis protein